MLRHITRITRPSKVTEMIADKIRSMIEDGVFKPGDKLPTERELCEAFGVGRSSVREALQSLEHIGLIESKPGVGRFLSHDAVSLLSSLSWGQMLERASMFELMEARRILEVATARLAAERATDDVIGTLESLLEEMKKAGSKDMDYFFEKEMGFHLTLSEACKNSILAELVNFLIHRVSAQAEKFLRTSPYTFDMTIKQFESIVQALKEGDSLSAGDKMREHLEIVKDALKKGRILS